MTISQINYDLILKFPKFIFLGEKVNNSTNLLNPRSYVNFGSSNQRKIGLDRNSLKFDFNYSWNKNDNFFNFSISQVELIKNKNIQNYFNIYSNSYETVNEIAKQYTTDAKYFSDGNLQIPNGIDLFLNDVPTIFSSVLNSDDLKTINYLSLIHI